MTDKKVAFLMLFTALANIIFFPSVPHVLITGVGIGAFIILVTVR